METDTQNIAQNEWSIYLIAFLVLLLLFFVQKYSYLIDKKLSKFQKKEPVWEGKPWPLITALFLGISTLLYNVFSPNDMQQNPANWHWPEWLLISSVFVLIAMLAIESITHFGKRLGLMRLLILGVLCTGFYFAGLLAGLIIVAILAIITIIYFINFWRKKMIIK